MSTGTCTSLRLSGSKSKKRPSSKASVLCQLHRTGERLQRLTGLRWPASTPLSSRGARMSSVTSTGNSLRTCRRDRICLSRSWAWRPLPMRPLPLPRLAWLRQRMLRLFGIAFAKAPVRSLSKVESPWPPLNRLKWSLAHSQWSIQTLRQRNKTTICATWTVIWSVPFYQGRMSYCRCRWRPHRCFLPVSVALLLWWIKGRMSQRMPLCNLIITRSAMRGHSLSQKRLKSTMFSCLQRPWQQSRSRARPCGTLLQESQWRKSTKSKSASISRALQIWPGPCPRCNLMAHSSGHSLRDCFQLSWRGLSWRSSQETCLGRFLLRSVFRSRKCSHTTSAMNSGRSSTILWETTFNKVEEDRVRMMRHRMTQRH